MELCTFRVDDSHFDKKNGEPSHIYRLRSYPQSSILTVVFVAGLLNLEEDSLDH